ncbi:unnamed protein product, partial [Rotaria magnacalcarata]
QPGGMMPRYPGQMMMPGGRPPIPRPYGPPPRFPPGVRPGQP